MSQSLNNFSHPFFIGIAGTGMSALAQYLRESGMNVAGSDRYFSSGDPAGIRKKLEEMGISCHLQDGTGLHEQVDLVVVSTAVEDSVPEVKMARERNIPILKRSELLAMIVAGRKTIAVGGTSGKSTTAAMIYSILKEAGMDPGIISGAGLVDLIRQGRIGNALRGNGEWLVIEADESDGSIVQYHPAIGLLLNIDKDHKDLPELETMFTRFRDQSQQFSVNHSHHLAAKLSNNKENDFSAQEGTPAGFTATGFRQEGIRIHFKVKDVSFQLDTPGRHNMENALAAIAASSLAGATLQQAASALRTYEGIYRRHQVLGKKNGTWLIDDYAHNPAKCAASIQACQPLAEKVVAWFQPHGYAPTKFLRNDFIKEIGEALRAEDEIWMSEIFYAGGTTTKDISAADLVDDLKKNGKKAFFVADRNQFLEQARDHLKPGTVLLLMGARDPSLEDFAKQTWELL